MANADTPFGLKPVREAGSGAHSGGVNMYYHAASDATALYVGDPVVKSGTADAAGIAGVTRAAAAGVGTSLITGTVVGFVPDGTTDQAGYGAASTAFYVLVADDPDLMFEVQEDSVGGALAAADIGLNADIIVAAGNAYSKRSGVELDTSTKATTATLPLKIVGLVPRPGNDFGANAKVLVKINTHSEANASAGL
jgi:hypothetical protein